MAKFELLSWKRVARRPAKLAWTPLCGVAILVFLSVGSQSYATSLVHCYQEDLDLVQQVLQRDCRGEVVTAEEARAIQKRRQDYLRETFESTGWSPEEGLSLRGIGSGFAVSTTGHLVTNHHVVKGCQALSALTPQGEESGARLIQSSPARDLALLQTSEEAPSRRPVLFASPQETLDPGAAAGAGNDGAVGAVRFLGYPNRGRPPRVPFDRPGRLSRMTVQVLDVPVIAFKGDIRPGNSGGPLLNHRGRVIGLVFAQVNMPAIHEKVAKAEAEQMADIGFALPLWEILLFLEQAGVSYPVGTDETDEAPDSEHFMVRINCWH